MALYIIFLGIVPTIALSSFGIWYVRNSGQNWKKSMISTYVSSSDRVTEKCKPHAFKPRGARRANSIGKNFYERFAILFSPGRGDNTRNNAGRIFTVSDDIEQKRKQKQRLEITKTDLISTTNPDVINCSNSIEYRKSLLLGGGNTSCVVASTDPPDRPSPAQSAQTVIESQARRNSHRSELGLKIAERIQQMQKKPTKNIKGLTVKTEVKFEHLNESPGGSNSNSSSAAPRTGDPLLLPPQYGKPYVSNTPAPFYNKKPPPPPAPAQHLKPKIWSYFLFLHLSFFLSDSCSISRSTFFSFTFDLEHSFFLVRRSQHTDLLSRELWPLHYNVYAHIYMYICVCSRVGNERWRFNPPTRLLLSRQVWTVLCDFLRCNNSRNIYLIYLAVIEARINKGNLPSWNLGDLRAPRKEKKSIL